MRYVINAMMKSKYIILGLMIAIISSSSMAYGQVAEEGWYPGKGLQPGLMVKYRISGFELTNDEWYTITVWFKGIKENGNWEAYIIMVDDKGNVVDGWTELSPQNLRPQGFVDDPDFDKARRIFRDSVLWVAGYASKDEPKSLAFGSTWGSIASIGGGGITLRIEEQGISIDAAGQSWDNVSTLIWFYKRDLKSYLWITDDFPLPLGGLNYAQVTQEPIPIQFRFDLLEYKITDQKPEPPKLEVELPEPPLSKLTPSGGFLIDLWWRPAVINAGEVIQVAPVIKDANSGRPITGVIYDIIVVDEDGNETFKEENITGEAGTSTHEIVFPKAGKYKVTVRCDSCQFGTIAPTPEETAFVEQAEFELIVLEGEQQMPLMQTTPSGAYTVELSWEPMVIEPEMPIQFTQAIKDAEGNAIEQAEYEVVIMDAEGNEIYRESIVASDGIGSHEVTFSEAGSYTVAITYNDETVEFNIQVVPEFPIGVIIALASIVAIVIAMTRYKPISIAKV